MTKIIIHFETEPHREPARGEVLCNSEIANFLRPVNFPPTESHCTIMGIVGSKELK